MASWADEGKSEALREAEIIVRGSFKDHAREFPEGPYLVPMGGGFSGRTGSADVAMPRARRVPLEDSAASLWRMAYSAGARERDNAWAIAMLFVAPGLVGFGWVLGMLS